MYYMQYTLTKLIGTVLVLLGIYLFIDNTYSQLTGTQRVRRSASPTAPSANSTAAQATTSADPHQQLLDAAELLHEAATRTKQAIEDATNWDRELAPLQQNAAGAQIASDTMLVDQFAYVVQRERMPIAELQSLQREVEALTGRVDTLSSQSPPTSLLLKEWTQVRRLHEQATEAGEQWKLAVQRGRAIMRVASRTNTATDVSNLKSQLEIADDKRVLDALDDERQTELDRAKRKLQQDAQQTELRERAVTPEVQAILAPFLEPRTIQPRLAGASIQFRNSLPERPMSLSAIRSLKALEDSELGRERLAKLGSHRLLSGPRWSLRSKSTWTDSDKEMLKQAQQMLIEFGPVLLSE